MSLGTEICIDNSLSQSSMIWFPAYLMSRLAVAIQEQVKSLWVCEKGWNTISISDLMGEINNFPTPSLCLWCEGPEQQPGLATPSRGFLVVTGAAEGGDIASPSGDQAQFWGSVRRSRKRGVRIESWRTQGILRCHYPQQQNSNIDQLKHKAASLTVRIQHQTSTLCGFSRFDLDWEKIERKQLRINFSQSIIEAVISLNKIFM